MQTELSAADVLIGKAEAERRRQQAIERRRANRNGGEGDLRKDVLGATGELAFCNMVGFPRSAVFRDREPKGHDTPDLPGRIDVKTVSSRNRRLLVTPDEAADKRFVLVSLVGRIAIAEGWLPGVEAMQAEFWADDLQPGRACWAVPKERLRPIGELEVILMDEGLHPQMTYEKIAKLAHAANRAYSLLIGEEPRPAWAQLTDKDREGLHKGVVFRVAHPEATAADCHENWMRDKAAAGWTWGETTDEGAKKHPNMVPFHDLPAEQQAKDRLFTAIVHAFIPPED